MSNSQPIAGFDPVQLTAKDPVSHMDISVKSLRYVVEHEGTTYLFCSRMCLKAFENDPRHYLDQPSRRR